jgi:predicted transcriptional regulator
MNSKRRKKARTTERDLGRRERQILDVIYRLKSASVAEIRAQLPDPPSYSSVRTMVTLLESKGFLRHTREGTKYIYAPTRSWASASRSALRHIINTFFSGSASDAVAAILDSSANKMDRQEIDKLLLVIEQAKDQGL